MSFRRFSRRLTELAPMGEGPWVVLRTVDSTNSLARRAATRHSGTAVFVAHHQSRGRGRGGHAWESPAGQGAYASLLVPAVESRKLSALPLLVGVGLVDGLRPRLGRGVSLRWPNDLVVGRQKLGGVLIEALAPAGRTATVIIGFGVNFGAPPLPGATSIRREAPETNGESSAKPEELAAVVVDLTTAVRRELQHLGDEAYAARRYAAASVHRDGEPLRCRTPAGTVEGLFRGFDRGGFLLLETAEGERAMGAGELIAREGIG